MMRIFAFFSLILSMLADFLYAPIVRAYMRETAMKFPHLPGQLWQLPMIGEVRITGVTDYHITYKITTDEEETSYSCKRTDFARLATSGQESKDNVIKFNVHRGKED